MSWLSSFSSVASSLASGNLGEQFSQFAEKVSQTVSSAAADLVSLDKLQDEFGDKDGKKALYAGLDIAFVLPRVAAMGFPCTRTSKIRSKNDVEAVSSFLRERAGGESGRVLVWNLSEESYDGAPFDGNVVDVKFPGQPCPPLATLFLICAASEAWLLADPSHIIAVHCMTGRGRTSLVCACLLAYMAGQGDVPVDGGANDVLKAIATSRGVNPETLCAPSQIRYIQYFGLILDSVKLRLHTDGGLLLRRVIFNGVPDLTVTIDEAFASLERSAAAAEKLKEAAAAARAANSPEAAAAAAAADAESESGSGAADNQSMLGTVLAKLEKVDEATEKLEQKAIDAVVDTATSVLNKAATRISNATTATSTKNQTSVAPAGGSDDVNSTSGGCRPFVQVFVQGKLAYSSLVNDTTADNTDSDQHTVLEVQSSSVENHTSLTDEKPSIGFDSNAVPKLVQPDWVNTYDGSARFSVGVPVTGDVVVRCRHLEAASFSCKNESKGNETLFRSAFHTGQLSGHVLRLTKRQLDVACSNPRVPSDFFVEIVFSPIADADPSLNFDQMSSAMSDDFGSNSIGNIPPKALNHPILGDLSRINDHLLHDDPTNVDSSSFFWNDLQRRKLKRAESAALAHTLQLQRQVSELEKQRDEISAGRYQAELANPLTLPSAPSLSSFFSTGEAVLGGVSGLLKSSLSQAASSVRAMADDSSSSQRSADRSDSSATQSLPSTSTAPAINVSNVKAETDFDRLERDIVSIPIETKPVPGNVSSNSNPSLSPSTPTTSTPSYPAEEDLDSLESFLASLATKK